MILPDPHRKTEMTYSLQILSELEMDLKGSGVNPFASQKPEQVQATPIKPPVYCNSHYFCFQGLLETVEFEEPEDDWELNWSRTLTGHWYSRHKEHFRCREKTRISFLSTPSEKKRCNTNSSSVKSGGTLKHLHRLSNCSSMVSGITVNVYLSPFEFTHTKPLSCWQAIDFLHRFWTVAFALIFYASHVFLSQCTRKWQLCTSTKWVCMLLHLLWFNKLLTGDIRGCFSNCSHCDNFFFKSESRTNRQ